MSDGDLTHTIHTAVARLAERLLDRVDTSPGRGFQMAPRIAHDSTDPELRRAFALGANAGWILLAFLFTLAMLLLAVPLKVLIGEGAGDPIALFCLAAALFCVAGAANVMWRMYWYVPQARRRAREDGTDSERFAKSMRRILPRNTSLVFQGAVALVTFIVAE